MGGVSSIAVIACERAGVLPSSFIAGPGVWCFRGVLGSGSSIC